mmetsp:Transcript_59119/g.190159  ORF Transcript_59119/g.190159 Transcript_59119/m.190159 type:complete len:347 (+) Transcript_59119:520-1560(+)
MGLWTLVLVRAQMRISKPESTTHTRSASNNTSCGSGAPRRPLSSRTASRSRRTAAISISAVFSLGIRTASSAGGVSPKATCSTPTVRTSPLPLSCKAASMDVAAHVDISPPRPVLLVTLATPARGDQAAAMAAFSQCTLSSLPSPTRHCDMRWWRRCSSSARSTNNSTTTNARPLKASLKQPRSVLRQRNRGAWQSCGRQLPRPRAHAASKASVRGGVMDTMRSLGLPSASLRHRRTTLLTSDCRCRGFASGVRDRAWAARGTQTVERLALPSAPAARARRRALGLASKPASPPRRKLSPIWRVGSPRIRTLSSTTLVASMATSSTVPPRPTVALPTPTMSVPARR